MAAKTNEAASRADDILLRALLSEDLPAAQALTSAVKWPHRLEDWAFMYGLGEGVAAVRDNALVGTAMAWRYGARHAALGLVNVVPAARGRGLGRRMTQSLLDGLSGRGVVLYSTEAGLPLYEKLAARCVRGRRCSRSIAPLSK